MNEFQDIIDFFIGFVQSLKDGRITPETPLEKIVWTVSWDSLAYIDNRKGALGDGYDFVKGIDTSRIKTLKIPKGQLSSQSQAFPDFVFKVREYNGRLICGSLLETKDSRAESISSFNSTLPSGTRSFRDIERLNKIVARIASLKDGVLGGHADYNNFQRRCFYMVRTSRGRAKVKISLVDGSFFETLPKDRLISQIFFNILEEHQRDEKIHISEKTQIEIEHVFNLLTDQAIIASTQRIEKASIKPRLRLMAEVEPEGNPHNQRHYPQIEAMTVNFLMPEKLSTTDLRTQILEKIPGIGELSLQHKRNGKYKVFSYKME
jgi:hypothetical protein